jgi:DNA-binding transcriptional MocR family regulator
VAAAFDGLKAEGVFTGRQGDGTYVTSGQHGYVARGDDRLYTFVSQVDARADVLDLRSAALPGLPLVADAVDNFPREGLHDLIATHGYLPIGLTSLREAVAEYYTADGVPTTADQILITSGAQQALRLAASAFVSSGATVLIEEPTFRGAIESLRALGVNLVPLPALVRSNFGAKAVQALRHLRPSLIVVQSTVHNPTGRMMSESERRELARVAQELDVPIVDDTTLADTTIDDVVGPPLAMLSDHVFTVGSVSKSFWGGIRVGWLRGDPATVSALGVLKGVDDLGTSLLAQCLTVDLLGRIDLARQLRRDQLRQSRDRLIEALTAELPEWMPIIPVGGASLWVRLPRSGAIAYAQRAERGGVLVLPGPTFSSVDGLDDFIRISFAGDPDLMPRAVAILAETWRRFSAGD